MSRRQFTAFFILLLIGLINAFTIPTGVSSEIRILPGTEENPVFEYIGTSLDAEIIGTEEDDFVRLDFNDAYPGGEIGHPSLPVIRKLIQIPFGASPRISIDQIATETYSLEDFGIFAPIYPRQAPVPKIRDYRPEFDFRKDVYESNTQVFDRSVEIIDVQTARNYRLALIEIRPVNYNPSAGEIEVIQS
ncbi:MAG: hypothetical protein ACP5G4_03540, partial [bacterium]